MTAFVKIGRSGTVGTVNHRLVAALLVVALVVAPSLGLSRTGSAMPTGGHIVSGDGSFDQTGNTLTISQLTDWLGIDWQSFNIGADELVVFVQPGSDSVALNRVLGPDPSEILGRLQANGQVFLVNPQGVLFGADARVDVGGLVASALDLRAADFDKGIFAFGDEASDGLRSAGEVPAEGPLAGRVVNLGELAAHDGGYIALVGTEVENAGWVLAPLGTVAFGAGERVTLGLDGRNLVSLSVDEAALGALIDNSGLIAADGGAVLLDVRAQDALQDTVLNMDGIVRARSMSSADGLLSGGAITLSGGEAGVVSVTGTIDVSGTAGGTSAKPGSSANGATMAQGGSIQITGEYIALDGEALLDASGTIGGEILVGGDYQGANPDVQNARAVFVGDDVMIDASARGEASSDAGRVIVWSDEMTRFLGNIRATGADSGGDGGFAEVSSAGHLDFRGLADLRAPRGKDGTLLLDPTDITIQNTGSDSGIDWDEDKFAPIGDPNNSVLTVSTLLAQLNLGDVIVSTSSGGSGKGDITIAKGTRINYTGGERSLFLRADGSITLVENVEITSENSPLHVILNSRANGAAAGHIRLGWQTKIVTNGGDIVLGGGTQDDDGRPTDFAVGTDGTSNGMGVWLDGSTRLEAGAGSISIRGRGFAGAGSGWDWGITGLSSSITTTSGDILLEGIAGGTASGTDGIRLTDVTISSQSGNIRLEGTGNSRSTRGLDLRNISMATDGSIELGGDDISIGGAIRATELVLNSRGAVTQASGSINVDVLSLRRDGQTVTLGSSSNRIGTVGGTVGHLSLRYVGGLNIDGLIASGIVSLLTTGPETLTQTGRLAAAGLVLDLGNAVANLYHDENDIGRLAANVGSLYLTNASDELTISSIDGIQGVNADARIVLRQLVGTVSQDAGADLILSSNTGQLGLIGNAAFNLPSTTNRLGRLAAHVDSLTLGFTGSALNQIRISSVSLATVGGTDVTGVTADQLTLNASSSTNVYQDNALVVGELNLSGASSEFDFWNPGNRVATLGTVLANDVSLTLGSGNLHMTGDVEVHTSFFLTTNGNVTQADDAAIKTGAFSLSANVDDGTFALTSERNEIKWFAARVRDSALTLNNAADLHIDSLGGNPGDPGIRARTFTLGIVGEHTVTQSDDAWISASILNLNGPEADFALTDADNSVYNLRSVTARNLSLKTLELVLGGVGSRETIDVTADLFIENRLNWTEIEGDVTVGGAFTFDGPRIVQSAGTAINANEMLIRGRGDSHHFELASRRNEIGRLAATNVHRMTLGFTGDLTIGTVAGVDGVTLQPSGPSNSTLTLQTDDGTLSQAAKLAVDELQVHAPQMNLVLEHADNKIGRLAAATVNSLNVEQSGSWTLGSSAGTIAVANDLRVRAAGANADLTIVGSIESQNDENNDMRFQAGGTIRADRVTIGRAAGSAGTIDVTMIGSVDAKDLTIRGARDVSFSGYNEAGGNSSVRLEDSSITGVGSVYFAPHVSSDTMGVAGGAGQFTVSSQSLHAIQDGFERIVFGKADGAGTLTFGTGGAGYSFNTDVVLQGSDIAIAGALSVGSHRRLTVQSEGQVLGSGKLTAGELLLDGSGQGVFQLDGDNEIAVFAADVAELQLSLIRYSNSQNDTIRIGTVGDVRGLTATTSAALTLKGQWSDEARQLTQDADAPIITPGLHLGTDRYGWYRLDQAENLVDRLTIHGTFRSASNFGGITMFHNAKTLELAGISDMMNNILVAAHGVDSNLIVTGDVTSRPEGGSNPDNTLILRADRSVIIEEGVSIGSSPDTNKPLHIYFNADFDDSGSGNIQILRGAHLSSNGGDIELGGGNVGLFGNPYGAAVGVGNGSARERAGIYIEGATLTTRGDERSNGSIELSGLAAASAAGAYGVHLVNAVLDSHDGMIEIEAGNDGTGDSIRLAGSTLTGTGRIELQPLDRAATIGLAGGSGVFNLSHDDLSAISPDFSEIAIGWGDGTGAITFGVSGGAGHSFANETVRFLSDTGTITFEASLSARDVDIESQRGDIWLGAPMQARDVKITSRTSSIRLDAPLTAERMQVQTDGDVIQGGAGTLDVDYLALLLDPLGLTGSATLLNPNNRVDNIAFIGRRLQLAGAGNLALLAVVAADSVSVAVDGALTLEGPVWAEGSGDAIVLAAGTDLYVDVDDFDWDHFNAGNEAHEGVLSTPNGRFLVYSTDPDRNVLGPLRSPGNLFGMTYADNGPQTIDPALGSRMIYSSRRTLIVDAHDILGLIYGDNHDFSNLTWTLVDGLVDGDSERSALSGMLAAAVSGRLGAGTHAGIITQGTLQAALGYDLEFRAGDVVVDRRPIKITARDQRVTYGESIASWWDLAADSPYGLVAGDELIGRLLSAGQLLGTDAAHIDVKYDAAGNVVGYTIGQGTLNNDNNSNYAIDFVPGTLTILPREIIIASQDLTKIYGDADPTFEFTVGGEGLAAGESQADVFTGRLSRLVGETVDGGPYDVTLGSLTANGNYKITGVTGRLTITPASISVRADDAARFYGMPNPEFNVTIGGFKFSHDESILEGILGFVADADQTSEPGLYAVTPSGLIVRADLAANYNLVFIPGTLTVSPGGDPQVPGAPAGAYRGSLAETYEWLRWRAEKHAGPGAQLVTMTDMDRI